MYRQSAKKATLSINEPHVSKLSLLMILCFWTTIYITGLRDLIYGYMGWSVLAGIWFISFIMSNTHLRRLGLTIISKHHSEIAMLFIWTLVILLNVLFDRGDVVTAYHHFAQTVVLWIVYLTAILYLYKSPLRFSVNVMVIIIALSVTCAIILPTLYSNPQIVRQLKYNTEMLSQRTFFFEAGTTNFYSCYAIAMPCLYVFSLQQKGIRRAIFITLCLLLIATIFLSTMASAVILVCFGVIGLLLFSVKSIKLTILLSILLSVILLVFFVYSDKFDQVDFVLIRVKENISNVRTGGIYNAERGSDALLSLKTIVENPLFGAGPVTEGTFNIIGEHSSWLDSIAQYGLLGFAPFACFLLLGFRRLWRSYLRDNKNPMTRARIICFVLYLVQGLANPWAFDSTAVALFITLAIAPDQS